MPRAISKKEAKELMRKPEKELQINKAVFVLQRRVEALQKRVSLLEPSALRKM